LTQLKLHSKLVETDHDEEEANKINKQQSVNRQGTLLKAA
jgi:hypothetical protein